MNFKKLIQVFAPLAIASMIFVPALAAIISPGDLIPRGSDIQNLPTELREPRQLIGRVFDVVIAVSAAIFMIMLLVGGVMYLTAAGNEEATGKAKRLIVDAIVGLVLVLAAYAIGIFILRFLGVRGVPGGGGTTL